MIILDTNVVSEVMKLDAEPRVLGWLERQDPDEVYITAIVVAEIQAGIERLPAGRKRDMRANRAALVLSMFGPVVIAFDEAAARQYGALVAHHPASEVLDAQVAAIALAYDATVSTRNTKHFEQFGVELIDPWSS